MKRFQRNFISHDTLLFQDELGKKIIEHEEVLALATNLRAKARQAGPAGRAQVLAYDRQIKDLRAIIGQLAKVGVTYQDRLDVIAKQTAANATVQIQNRLDRTHVKSRDPTGNPRHLRSLIVSVPIDKKTGWVGVARTSTLELAINPYTFKPYGPYWRAQEYGTGENGVPSQVNRKIRGFFYDTGGAGVGVRPVHGATGPHPVFISGKARPGPRGGLGPKAVIHREIQGRHFIRDGADNARTKWESQMRANDRRAARALRPLI